MPDFSPPVQSLQSTPHGETPTAFGFACLQLPNFALRSLVRAEPGLARRALALVEGEGRRARLLQVSPEAQGLGPGLAPTVALARCPGLLLRSRQNEAEVEAQRLLLAAGLTLSPRVEATAPGCCTVDLQGADPARTLEAARLRLAEFPGLGFDLRIGISTTPLLARYASELAAPLLLVSDPKAFLETLPLATAQPSEEQARVLEGWGLRTLGALTALSKAEVGLRLGAEGLALWERAAGQDRRLLRLVEPARSFAAEWSYDPPVEALEPLLFHLRRYAERVAFELRAASLAAERLTLRLTLENQSCLSRDFRLPEPSADPDAWLRVFQTHLETLRTAERVSGLRLYASPTRPPQKQDGLFDTGLRDPALFWETLARLEALLGQGSVGTPEPLDSHQPGAYVLRRPPETVPAPEPPALHPPRGPALRRYQPPLPVQLHFGAGTPSALHSSQISGPVLEARGPWRLSGAWWTPRPWKTEIWQLQLPTGLYQVALAAEGWTLEGELD